MTPKRSANWTEDFLPEVIEETTKPVGYEKINHLQKMAIGLRQIKNNEGITHKAALKRLSLFKTKLGKKPI